MLPGRCYCSRETGVQALADARAEAEVQQLPPIVGSPATPTPQNLFRELGLLPLDDGAGGPAEPLNVDRGTVDGVRNSNALSPVKTVAHPPRSSPVPLPAKASSVSALVKDCFNELRRAGVRQIRWDLIKLGEELDSGSFGTVAEAMWYSPTGAVAVAVKTSTREGDMDEILDLFKLEAQMAWDAAHTARLGQSSNIVSTLGVSVSWPVRATACSIGARGARAHGGTFLDASGFSSSGLLVSP